MARAVAILIFDGAEEMDFVGPWEVLGAAADGSEGGNAVPVAGHAEPVTCVKETRKGLSSCSRVR